MVSLCHCEYLVLLFADCCLPCDVYCDRGICVALLQRSFDLQLLILKYIWCVCDVAALVTGPATIRAFMRI